MNNFALYDITIHRVCDLYISVLTLTISTHSIRLTKCIWEHGYS